MTLASRVGGDRPGRDLEREANTSEALLVGLHAQRLRLALHGPSRDEHVDAGRGLLRAGVLRPDECFRRRGREHDLEVAAQHEGRSAFLTRPNDRDPASRAAVVRQRQFDVALERTQRAVVRNRGLETARRGDQLQVETLDLLVRAVLAEVRLEVELVQLDGDHLVVARHDVHARRLVGAPGALRGDRERGAREEFEALASVHAPRRGGGAIGLDGAVEVVEVGLQHTADVGERALRLLRARELRRETAPGLDGSPIAVLRLGHVAGIGGLHGPPAPGLGDPQPDRGRARVERVLAQKRLPRFTRGLELARVLQGDRGSEVALDDPRLRGRPRRSLGVLTDVAAVRGLRLLEATRAAQCLGDLEQRVLTEAPVALDECDRGALGIGRLERLVPGRERLARATLAGARRTQQREGLDAARMRGSVGFEEAPQAGRGELTGSGRVRSIGLVDPEQRLAAQLAERVRTARGELAGVLGRRGRERGPVTLGEPRESGVQDRSDVGREVLERVAGVDEAALGEARPGALVARPHDLAALRQLQLELRRSVAAGAIELVEVGLVGRPRLRPAHEVALEIRDGEQ